MKRNKNNRNHKKEKNIGLSYLKDPFYTKLNCDRCGQPLLNGRTLSMFNMDCLCKKCKKEEIEHPDYEKARAAELEEIKKGNYNFKGIGYPKWTI